MVGLVSGFTAGAWLGAAEAPTKLVTVGISPVVISLIMVIGVFLARWSVPALILGTSSIRADVEADAASVDLGDFGGMHLGGGEYADDFCDSRCGVEHCVSAVEFEQFAGNFVGIYFFQ